MMARPHALVCTLVSNRFEILAQRMSSFCLHGAALTLCQKRLALNVSHITLLNVRYLDT